MIRIAVAVGIAVSTAPVVAVVWCMCRVAAYADARTDSQRDVTGRPLTDIEARNLHRLVYGVDPD